MLSLKPWLGKVRTFRKETSRRYFWPFQPSPCSSDASLMVGLGIRERDLPLLQFCTHATESLRESVAQSRSVESISFTCAHGNTMHQACKQSATPQDTAFYWMQRISTDNNPAYIKPQSYSYARVCPAFIYTALNPGARPGEYPGGPWCDGLEPRTTTPVRVGGTKITSFTDFASLLHEL